MNIVGHRIFALFLTSAAMAALAIGQPGEKETEEIARARHEFWLAKRLDQNGQFSMEAVLRAKSHMDQKRAATRLSKAQTPGHWNWEWLGPGNIGGRIKDILINPFNPAQMWIASPGGGIWVRNQRSLYWSPVDDFLPMLNVVTLAIDPLIPQNLYAGTGEYEYQGGYGTPTVRGRDITGVGIYKSTDGGVSWFHLTSTDIPDFHFVSRLAHYPATTNRLLAATVSGLYRTTDGGTSWTRILVPDNHEAVRDVKINPANPIRVLVGTTMDVYLTTDGGSTWARQTTGATNKMPASPGRCELAIAPTNTNIMYVSIAMTSGGDQLWRTTDGGTTWQLRKSNFTKVNAATNAIWVSPTDPNFIVVGGTDYVARSWDGGLTDTAISDWRGYHNGRTTPGFSPHGDFHVIVSHPSYDGVTNKTVYVGDDGGIQMTSDITKVSLYSGWSNLAYNLGITQFYGGAASPDGKMFVGGTQDLYNLNYYATAPSWGAYSGPQGWWNFIYGDGGFAAIDYTNGSHIYTEAQWFHVDRSVDSGKTYNPAINGLTDAGNSSRALFVAPLVMDPNTPTTLYGGSTSIWRTTDGAANWGSIRSPLVGSPKCSAIDVYKSNSNVVWVGYDNGLVSFTTNSGSTWTDVGKPGGSRFVTDIAINPTPLAYAEVVVTVGGYTTNNVWLTSDNGATWVQRTGQAPNNLPAIQINTVRYHPLQTNRIYVGTDLGVFTSTDKGLSWDIAPQSLKNEGPVNTPVEELFWQGTTYLVAATHGRGMFRCNPLVSDVQETPAIPVTSSLEQNYPNPFNPLTIIKYTVGGNGGWGPGASDVSLVVYDVLGRKVAVLVNEKKAPGSYEVKFDASGLATGVYLFRLTAGGFVQTRKMIVLR